MAGGAVGPSHHVDDVRFGNCTEIWRRIHPTFIIFDSNLGRHRPSSQAFKDSSDGTPMSVLIGRIVSHSSRDEFSVLRSFPAEALSAFTARFARSQGQGVESAPVAEEPAHAYVFGSKRKKIQAEFAKRAIWVVEPDAHKRVVLQPDRPFRRLRCILRRLLRTRRHFNSVKTP